MDLTSVRGVMDELGGTGELFTRIQGPQTDSHAHIRNRSGHLKGVRFGRLIARALEWLSMTGDVSVITATIANGNGDFWLFNVIYSLPFLFLL